MLTPKQETVLNKISDFIAKFGKSPTIEELQTVLEQKSKRGVVQYLDALEKKGFITRGSGFRSIRLGNGVGFQTMLNIPILGIANAGQALSIAEETEYGTLPISKKVISGDEKNYFIVKVDGTSMNKQTIKGKVIDNGSFVLIKKDEQALNNSDTFLFIVDGAATIKKYKQEGENIYLTPNSKDDYHKPIILDGSDQVYSNGKVVDVFNVG